jgi:isoquinoline 1-oxidoreductase beta subunit
MRAAGSVARVALIAAEARLWTERGALVLPDGTRMDYVDLAVDAASSDLPEVTPLRARVEWRL